ncbi:MAG TPA: hypothetical protein VIT45_03585 [Allosphingosinicella sp.]
MDVDALRKELEEHLKKNPDEHAPSGFRDRFESVLEQLGGDDGIPDEAWVAQLHRIRDEAEAAAKCGCDDGGERGDEDLTEPADGGDSPPVEQRPDDHDTTNSPADSSGPRIAESEGQGPAGLLQRFGIPLGVAALALAAAYFTLRS